MVMAPWVDAAWLVDANCPGIDPAKIDEAQIVAAVSFVLFHLSGKQFGIRNDVVEIETCPASCWEHSDPSYVNRGRIELAGPAVVTSVKLNGAVMAAGEYRIEDGRYLRRTVGGWPCSGVTVSYAWGKAVPEAGVLAAQVLACEIARSMTPNAACKLPARVQSITRQGMTMALLDPQEFLDNGRTGLYLVDLFLSTVNPSGKRRRATISSPDIPRGVRP